MCRSSYYQSAKPRKRSGFTLVELLMSIAIIGIIGGMVSVALSGASREAKQTRAEGMTNSLNLLMLQIYEETGRARVNLPSGFTTPQTRALSLLMWKRDWLRCSLPERREDLTNGPVAVPYPDGSGGTFLDNNRNVPSITSGTNATGIRSQEILRYRRHIARSIGAAKNISVTSFAQLVDGNDANGEWTAEHQSGECLYLILSTHNVNGMPATDMLRQRDVGDIDDDGMPEVLDPWENPYGYMRWPVGLSLTPDWNKFVESPESTNQRNQWTPLAQMKIEMGKESYDILYSDPRYLDNDDASLVNAEAEDPFPLVPVVVSAGADGVFDLFGLDNNETVNPERPPIIDYTTTGFPNSSPSAQNPPNFPAASPFVDPFMDGARIENKLGARRDYNDNRINESSDNVLPTSLM